MSAKQGFFAFVGVCLFVLFGFSRGVSASWWESPPGGDEIWKGIELSNFGYQLHPRFLGELGARLGCEQASRYATFPKNGNLTKTIQDLVNYTPGAQVSRRDNLYRRMKEELWNRKSTEALCRALPSSGAAGSNGAGIEALYSLIKAMEQRDGTEHELNFVAVGGLGSYLNSVSTLEQAIQHWKSISASFPVPTSLHFRSWSCSKYAPNDFCVPEFLASFKEKPSSGKKRWYLLWGYSQGGNIILDSLSLSPELREQTLGVVIVGTPVAGLSLAPLMYDLMEQVEKYRTQDPVQFTLALKLLRSTLSANSPGIDGGLAEALLGDIPTVKRTFYEILPSTRKEYLYEHFRYLNFERRSRKPIPVYQVAGVLDISNTQGLPSLAIQQGELGVNADALQSKEIFSLLTVPLFSRYPFNDFCVGLQHAVIPKDAVPAGLKSELIALFNLSHSSIGLTRTEPGQALMPYELIADALLATTAYRLTNDN